jgi:hypothetical protein
MNLTKYFAIQILLLFSTAVCFKLSKVCFVILSQPHKRHAAIAEETSKRLKDGLSKRGVDQPHVFVTHKDLPVRAAWTYFPLFPGL